MTWVLLTAAEPDKGYPSAPVVYLCSCFGAGILVAVILMFYWRIGLYLLAGKSTFLTKDTTSHQHLTGEVSSYSGRRLHPFDLHLFLATRPHLAQRLRATVHRTRLRDRWHLGHVSDRIRYRHHFHFLPRQLLVHHRPRPTHSHGLHQWPKIHARR